MGLGNLSQEGLLNVKSLPTVPTQFDTDSGSAIPAANILNIFGGTDITTSGAGNTVTISFTGGAVITTLTGNSGGPVSPTAGNINTLGTGSITVVGNPGTSTLTAQLTGLTNHNVLVGAGTATITNVPPSATAGVPLISNGAAVDPSFGTAVVSGGGTGSTTFNINGVVISNTTNTGVLTSLTLANGQIVIGATGLPPLAANITAGTNVTVTNAANSITIAANATSQVINVTAVSSTPYVATATDYFLAVDTSVARTIQLPNAPTTGRVFVIKDSSGTSAANNITVTTVGGVVNFDGATSYTINSAYASIMVVFDGAAYEIF